jgi:hypothetical protein
MIDWLPAVTSSCRPPLVTRIGVAQLTSMLRATRQASLPVFRSRPTMNDFSPLSSSHCTITSLS